MLPKKIAVPLNMLANKVGAKPFIEYAFSYALSNFAYINKNAAEEDLLAPENLKIIRGFDGTEAESGFILVIVNGTCVVHAIVMVYLWFVCGYSL